MIKIDFLPALFAIINITLKYSVTESVIKRGLKTVMILILTSPLPGCTACARERKGGRAQCP